VITPSFNQAPFIERTIQSVLSQTGDFELEYFVIDGASTDGTVSILQKYDGLLTWASEPDSGQSDAINKGLRRATGDIVGWLNSDDTLRPGALARIVAAFRSSPGTKWVHGRCDYIDVDDRVIRRWISVYKDRCCRCYSYDRLLRQQFISQLTVFWRRELLDCVGYLDPDLHMAMDYDLWLRFGRHWEPLYIPDRLGCFRWHASSKSASAFRRQFCEIYRIAQRHAPGRTWLHLCNRMVGIRTMAVYAVLDLVASLLPTRRADRLGPCPRGSSCG
jgi:glycosyltransferase involved in cell wall biosynthesis